MFAGFHGNGGRPQFRVPLTSAGPWRSQSTARELASYSRSGFAVSVTHVSGNQALPMDCTKCPFPSAAHARVQEEKVQTRMGFPYSPVQFRTSSGSRKDGMARAFRPVLQGFKQHRGVGWVEGLRVGSKSGDRLPLVIPYTVRGKVPR
jgi:hypothetical protein